MPLRFYLFHYEGITQDSEVDGRGSRLFHEACRWPVILIEAVAQVYVKDNALKENIIQGLTQPIPLAKMRQHLNQVVITGTTNFAARWRLLYKEFDAKYHMRVADRMSNINYPGTRLDYIEKELKQLPDLFQLACVMFAESYDVVMAKWNAVKRNNYLDREINVKKTELNQNLNK